MPSVDPAISRGLEFLAAHQATDGSIGPGDQPMATGLALMAFLANGHTPSASRLDRNIGRYGLTVRAAIDYLLSQAQPDGSFGRRAGGQLGQAVAAAALADAYGVENGDAQRKRMAAALNAWVKSAAALQNIKKPQTLSGGWSNLNAADSDLLTTVWTLLSLRACQDAGAAIPRQSFSRAWRFVLNCYQPASRTFASQQGAEASPLLTGAGILGLLACDGAKGPEVQSASALLASYPFDDTSKASLNLIYLSASAALILGDPIWSAASRSANAELLGRQLADGGWPAAGDDPAGGLDRVADSALAVLTLSLPNRLIPGFMHGSQ